MDKHLITTAEAASRRGVSPRRIRALIQAGRLRAHPINARLTLVEAKQVDELELKPGRPKRK